MNCKTVPVGAKGKLNSWNGCAVVARRHGKMLPDVGMVQMYSKSANVNELHGFCVDRLAPLFAWTGPPPSSYGFSASWFAMPFRGTLHHPYICPCFWRKIFYTPLTLRRHMTGWTEGSCRGA